MALLKQFSDKLFIALDDTILIYDKEKKLSETKLPEIIVPPNLSKGQTDVFLQEHRRITSMSISRTGEQLLVSTQNKQVVVFNAAMQVTCNFVLNRAASKVRFTPEDDILIADKTGDAYLYKSNKLSLILGHLSMLLDVLVTGCGRFIITCDRDEKIRVSHYPNSYNIASFCLGHQEFVTNIEISRNVLISGSGDGTIRFWDYKNGIQLAIIDTNDIVKDKSVIQMFCNKMDQDNVEVKALPITDMQIYECLEKTLIAVTLLRSHCIQIYELKDIIKIRHLQNIFVDNLASFSLSKKLVILCKNGFEVYELQDNYEKSDTFAFAQFNFNKYCINDEEDVSVLYKRKFDNVQEYLERKKLRIESK